MASRRLLLFADGNSSTNKSFDFNGNSTLDCIFTCIGVCLSDICFPDPPTTPISLPRDDNSSDSTIPIKLHHRDRITPSLIIAAVSAVAGSFALLLTLYFYLVFRRRARRHNLHQGFDPAADIVTPDGDGDGDGDDTPPGGGEIEHHIWYIRTQGLDDSTIASITSWIYKSSDGLIDSKDCSVCLGEFYDGELIRLLPKCSHAFHLSCIDRWLRSHVNCPLCRAPIVSPAIAGVPAPSPASPATVVNLDPAELVVGSPNPMENSQSVSEEFEIGIVIQPTEGLSSRSSMERLGPSLVEEDENLQPIRRSVSMDGFSLDVLIRNGREEEEEEEGIASANREKGRGFSKGNLSRKLHTKMDGSLSSQSSRWFFPRYGRPRNSVLPL